MQHCLAQLTSSYATPSSADRLNLCPHRLVQLTSSFSIILATKNLKRKFLRTCPLYTKPSMFTLSSATPSSAADLKLCPHSSMAHLKLCYPPQFSISSDNYSCNQKPEGSVFAIMSLIHDNI